MLSRVAGLFSARGYNIESLSVGETLDPTVSRMTLVVRGDAVRHRAGHQAAPQADRRDQGHRPQRGEPRRARDAPAQGQRRAGDAGRDPPDRRHLPGQGGRRDARPPTRSRSTGEESKIEAIIELLRPFGIQEIVRTGKVAIARGPEDPAAPGRGAAGQVREAAVGRRPTTRRWSGSRTDLERRTAERKARGTMPAKIYYDQDADLGLLRGKTVADHRLRQPGARPRPEPEGLRPGRGGRALQGLEELGQGREGRAQGDDGGRGRRRRATSS